ncbi:uncharacterized protein LOC133122166 [Conger conger]|uniref:uncharacterized protein LOC133122166 n=1 Tax=Conger conger TaxID=82655 RepID=UPI002A59C8A2|nr:uncharacterized protein LOC133122166 [Conger conger]XP_061087945.1 uncharacterized protein LOC133122166 [Conger conger]
MSVLLVLTILIPSITCSPLLAQTPFTSSDYDLNPTKEQPGSPGMTLERKAQPSPSFTSSPLKNFSTFPPQPSNVRKTTAVQTLKNTAITVAEPMAESILETTIVAILKTTEVPSIETDSEPAFETPLPNLETVTSAIHQTSGVTLPQIPVQTSHHGSTLISTQATTPETFISSSTSQTSQSTTNSIIPEFAQTTLSKPNSDSKSSPAVASATPRDTSNGSSKTNGFGKVIIIIVLSLVCISGIIFLCMLFNKRKKTRSENFNSSFRNGGSSKSKRKKATEDEAWFGPVAFKGEEEVEAGGEGRKEVDGKSEGEGVQVVLSTFMAKEGEKDGVNGGCIEVMKDTKKEEEVPLMVMDEDVEKTDVEVTSSTSMSSSLPPALSETDAGEQNGSAAFCLTSAV